MKRSLIYLAIFTTFFWVSWLSLGYLTSPLDQHGRPDPTLISLFFIFFFGGTTLLTTFIASAYKASKPNRKLPPLLVKDSLVQGFILGTWLTGILVLQLLRSANYLNLTLWIIILIAAEWFLQEWHKNKPVEN